MRVWQIPYMVYCCCGHLLHTAVHRAVRTAANRCVGSYSNFAASLLANKIGLLESTIVNRTTINTTQRDFF